jgi:hypothetical protein
MERVFPHHGTYRVLLAYVAPTGYPSKCEIRSFAT